MSEIQLIRGGSSLLYGPEPEPAVNFVMRHPEPGSPLSFYTEQIGGSDGLYSTYNVIQGTKGPWEFRVDGGYVRSDGQRENSQYHLWQVNGYFGYRPDQDTLFAVDTHISRFDGGDPGQITYQQFLTDPDHAATPNAHDWVDHYPTVFRFEHSFADGWLLQAKAWFTNHDMDARGGVRNGFTPVSNENFWNGGVDVRLRKDWGEGTMFKGSVLTFGGTVYHGEGPWHQYNSTDPDAGPNAGGTPTLDQDRSSDYQAFFVEDLFRLGKWHFVPSFRLDHEDVEVDTHVGRFGPREADIDHWVPLWGFGMGNDFGHLNETYFSASSGWRPTRWLDIGSPFQNLSASNAPDPFHSLDFELGVHGTPIKGLWYNVGGFWMVLSNRTETLPVANPTSPGEVILQNSGTSRNRGFEGELSYDFLAGEQEAPKQEEVDGKDKDFKSVKEAHETEPSCFFGYHLILFSNIQLLDAVFTEGAAIDPTTGKTHEGNTPAFAPTVLYKGGITLSKEKTFDVSLFAVYVSDQYGLDSNQPVKVAGVQVVPAKIPSYYVLNLAGDWHITKHLKLIAGISNLTNKKYYSRVFLNGFIEPAPQRSGYAGPRVGILGQRKRTGYD